jgi:hypothetical protein
MGKGDSLCVGPALEAQLGKSPRGCGDNLEELSTPEHVNPDGRNRASV